MAYQLLIEEHPQWVEGILTKAPILVEKVHQAVQIPVEEVPNLLLEVIRFLNLSSFTSQKLTPSYIVDLAWHEFILCTYMYQQFCHEKLGKFIHHHPGGQQQENQKQFIKTIKIYELYIGKPPQAYWGTEVATLTEGSLCGNCLT